MTKYSFGRNAEYKARDELIKEGFQVMRSAGSKGHWDLIAWNEKFYRHVQLKRGEKEMSKWCIEKLKRELLPLVIPQSSSKEIWNYYKVRGKVYCKRHLVGFTHVVIHPESQSV